MSPPRLHIPDLPPHGAEIELPPVAARHVQVLRLQPGSPLVVFDGRGGQWQAEVRHMGRQSVTVSLGAPEAVSRELRRPITLAVAMPANDRMDDLVEKATELGVAAVQPLVSERSVLRLSGDRAAKRVAHWQAVAVAACEQCGRNRLPVIHPVQSLQAWLASLPRSRSRTNTDEAADEASGTEARWLLSPRAGAIGLAERSGFAGPVLCLSGPEGGLSEAEEAAAEAVGFQPVRLGPRILRADTAPLAVLAALALHEDAA